MTRRAVLALAAAPLAAQDGRARRWILDASRALQEGSAARFLGYFAKRELPDYRGFRETIEALRNSKPSTKPLAQDKATAAQ